MKTFKINIAFLFRCLGTTLFSEQKNSSGNVKIKRVKTLAKSVPEKLKYTIYNRKYINK